MKEDKNAIITKGNDLITITSDDNYDIHKYLIDFSPFRINYFINETWIMEVNSKDLLYFESPSNVESIEVSQKFCFI